MGRIIKIGFGGGCHWCTEAVFQAVQGVTKVEQGYIASRSPFEQLSEGVIVHFDPSIISLEFLIAIHFHTHQSTKMHSFRHKYRSAMYYYEEEQKTAFAKAYSVLQKEFEQPIITKALPFVSFTASRESIQNYYKKHPEAPFCKRYITPKLNVLKEKLPSILIEQPGRLLF